MVGKFQMYEVLPLYIVMTLFIFYTYTHTHTHIKNTQKAVVTLLWGFVLGA